MCVCEGWLVCLCVQFLWCVSVCEIVGVGFVSVLYVCVCVICVCSWECVCVV